MIKILHITGVGHSGSTLLATLLAQSPEVASYGELGQLPKSFVDAPHRCSCGQLVPDCLYWKDVVNIWKSSLSGLVISEHAEKLRYLQAQCLKSLKSGHDEPSGNDIACLVEEIDMLYETLCTRENVSCLVDNSKNVGRAALLAAYSRNNIRILHLVRDPRGVVWSHRKSRANKPGMVEGLRKGRSVKNTTKRWVRDNRLVKKLDSKYKDTVMTLRYEDLICNTLNSLERISEFSGMNFQGASDLLHLNRGLEAPHMVAGNMSVRMKPITELALDKSWQANLKICERLWIVMRAHALMIKFGYL